MKKPKIRYTLESKSKDTEKRIKPELIIAEVNAGFITYIGNKRKYGRFKYSLEANILPKNFGLAKENFRFNQGVFEKYSKSNRSVKTAMEAFERVIDTLHSNYIVNKIYPSPIEFKKDVEILMGRKERETKFIPTVYEFLQEKIKTDTENIDSSKKEEIKPNTIKTYKTLGNYIENYESVTKAPLTFDRLNETTYWNFWDIQDEILRGVIEINIEGRARKQQIKPMGFLVNSICKYQKTLIKLLRDAKKKGIETRLNLDDENLVLEEKPNSKDFYIDEKNLLKIINAEVTSKELTQAKDYVILSSLLGMRYESMEDAYGTPIKKNKENKYEFLYIHSRQIKTGTEVIIPLMKPVQEVIKRHNNQFPKFASNQEINRWIKELFATLKISSIEKVIYHTYKLGIIPEEKPISEIISTHDFRKTFYSNLLLMNVEERFIDNVTHPDKAKANAMGGVYDRTKMLDKAKQFYDEINRVNKIKKSKIYTYL